jgi:Reverse transcriptase (RNA-dependent DNA polymerase)
LSAITSLEENKGLNLANRHHPNELGVAQGSCLGPSLFIFYMNRIAGAVGEARFNLFADDTLISAAEGSLEDAVQKKKQLTRIFITLIQTT